MDGSMRGPRAKIERAKKHVKELEVAIGALVFSHSANPDVILVEEDPDGSQRRYKVGDIPHVPDPIATMAGDVVHNLRSALDLLFGQLVLANGESLGKDYFPISETGEKFEARCTAEIKGRVGEDAFKLIRATDAYGGGKGDALWRVHALDIEDKHRLLFVIWARLPWVHADNPDRGIPPEAIAAFESMGLLLNPADKMVPLKEGDVLFIDNEPSVPKTEPKFALFVAFSESEIVQGEPVLPALLDLTEQVEGTVEAFAPLLP